MRSAGGIGQSNRARAAPGAALLSERRVTASRLLRLRRNAGVTPQQFGNPGGVTAQQSAATPFQQIRRQDMLRPYWLSWRSYVAGAPSSMLS